MLVIGVIIVILGIFQAGVFVGFHRAGFSYHMGENYYRAFGDNERGEGGGMMGDRGFPNAHGAVGRIIKISIPTMSVLGPDNIEKIITMSDDTKVRYLRDATTILSLKQDDYVVVIGSPNDEGEIVARFIRILPPPTQLNTPDVAPTATISTSSVTQ